MSVTLCLLSVFWKIECLWYLWMDLSQNHGLVAESLTWLLSASITGRCLRLLEVYLTAVKCVSKLYVEELKTGVSNVILQH